MNKDEERFIKKNVELLKALTDGDPVKIKDVRRAIEESLQRLTTLPPDHVMTRAMIRRSKWLAEDTEYKYICPHVTGDTTTRRTYYQTWRTMS